MKKMNRDLHVLVTRPDSFADNLVNLIKKTGATCMHFPLLTIERVINSDIQKKMRTLNNYDAVICISQNAAYFGLEELKQLFITPALHLQWFAFGGSTADVLRAHGLSVTTPTHSSTSEALLALSWFTSVGNKRVMIWKGVGGRELLEQALKHKGADVDTVELYQRVMPVYEPNTLDQLLIEHDINIIMITSGEALHNLWQLANDKTRVTNITVMVPSERVADQARTLGFNNVLCANGADDQTMLACLQRYQLQTEANV